MKRLAFVLSVALAGSAACSGGASANPGGKPTTPAQKVQPKLTIDEARKVALAKVPGTIDHEKLKITKKEAVYSFKIVATGETNPDALTKVEVDGTTGAVLKVKAVKRKDKNGKGKDSDDD